MMKMTTVMLSLLGALTAGAQDDAKYREFQRESFKREDEGLWRRIAWQKNMAAAVAKAKTDGKPILVVLVVGEKGRKGAAEC